MKYLSRLTALLLAFVLLFSSSVGVIAESDISDLTRSGYDQMVSAAKEAAEAEAAAAAQEAASQPIYVDQSDVVYVPEIPDQTKRFDIYEVEEELSVSIGEEVSVTLPESGKIDLTVNADAQWQIYVPGADIWVDIAGATGSTFALTYARIGGMLSGDTAKVRALSGEEAATLNVTVAYGSVLPEVEEEDNFAAEPMMASTFAMRSSDANAGIMLAADAPDTSTHYITIEYLFADGTQAANPWTASAAGGSTFNQTISSPTVLGYTPDKAEVTINQTVNGDIKETVTYSPAEVEFTVKHLQQNINDDGYTLIEEESKKGYTNTEVGANLGKVYSGFYRLNYDSTVKIAADGSTVVEIKYDRYYYLMSFDLDGGYGVEPVYARFGATIDDVGTPTKAGYRFEGWTLDPTADPIKIETLPGTMPALNLKYTAVWKVNDTAKVTIVFWGENADDEEYSYIKSAEVNVKPGTSFTYDENGSLICGQENHNHTEACGYNCGQTAHTHSENCYKLTCTQEVHSHSDGCYTCNAESHTHSTACYAGVGNRQSVYSSIPSNPAEGQVHDHFYYGNLIYIKGTWYRYSGSTASGSIAPTTCGKTESTHTHTDACIGCGKTPHVHTNYTGSCYTLNCALAEHSHTDACGYNCGKTAHSHTSSCYMSDAGLDSDLWTLVKSDTVTVNADGSTVVNVYYDRTEFTLTFKDGNTTVYTLKEKWGSDISSHWPIKGNNGTTYDSGERWDPSGSSVYKEVLVYLDTMPAESFTLTKDTKNYDTFVMHYMLEVLPGTTGTAYNNKSFKEGFSVTAKYNYVTEAEDFFDIEGFTQWTSYPSFDSDGELDIRGGGDVYFYYTRNVYDIQFYNPTELLETENDVPYEAPLGTYNFTPTPSQAPDKYEPGSVVFAGWYLNPECTGDEYVLSEHTMPLGTENGETSLSLYAKWVPVTHKVNVYLTNEMTSDVQLGTTQVVQHGETAVEPAKGDVVHPSSDKYVFVGWFYEDEDGNEKAFDFSMPVNKDLNVYAKWRSDVLVEYTIKYAVENEDESLTYIAEDTTGSALAGTTKTFDAKYGEALKEEYRNGYFPETNSHSIDFTIEGPNDYTFIYVPATELPYVVKYLEVGTEKVLHEQKEETTTEAIHTETFVPIAGYMPDAYQKRLILSADTSKNEIIFWYKADNIHAPVQVIHYTQNAEGEGYAIYQETTDLNGVINSSYSANVLTIDGFTFNYATANDVLTDPVDGKVTSTVTEQGLILELYYNRNLYPYEYRFLEQGTTDVELADPVKGEARYGSQVTQTAPYFPGYKVSEDSIAINIQIEDGENAVKNLRIFYYTQEDVTINYEVVGPDGCGTVSPTFEKVKKVTGTAVGSTATPSSNEYRFVGWFTDPECKNPVTSLDGTITDTTHFTPVKEPGNPNADPALPAMYEDATFYALFEYNLTDLTIKKTGLTQNSDDDRESAIFVVTDKETGKEVATIVIPANDKDGVTIDNLTVGKTYVVTEVNAWTWRYDDQTAKEVTIVAPPTKNEVTFNNTNPNPYWLGGDNVMTNVFE